MQVSQTQDDYELEDIDQLSRRTSKQNSDFQLFDRQKIDFALIRVENDIKEYHKNRSPTVYCKTQISSLQTNCELPNRTQPPFNQFNGASIANRDEDEYQLNGLQYSQIDMQTPSQQFIAQEVSQKPIGKIIIEMRFTEGAYQNCYFQFHLYFMAKYSFNPPYLYLTHYQPLNSSLNTERPIIPCLNNSTNEVCLKILKEEWSPVLNLQMIILAIELMVGEVQSTLIQQSPRSSQTNFQLQNDYYELQRSHQKLAQQQPQQLSQPSHIYNSYNNQSTTYPRYNGAQNLTFFSKMSKKRKRDEITREDTNDSNSSDDLIGIRNPVKKLRRGLDNLQLSSPVSQKSPSNSINYNFEEDDQRMEIIA